jgi:hypothetical protein
MLVPLSYVNITVDGGTGLPIPKSTKITTLYKLYGMTNKRKADLTVEELETGVKKFLSETNYQAGYRTVFDCLKIEYPNKRVIRDHVMIAMRTIDPEGATGRISCHNNRRSYKVRHLLSNTFIQT